MHNKAYKSGEDHLKAHGFHKEQLLPIYNKSTTSREEALVGSWQQ